jgi:Flp pilus assembly pilin Flp
MRKLSLRSFPTKAAAPAPEAGRAVVPPAIRKRAFGARLRAGAASWLRGERGLTAVEYGLLFALVGVAAVIALQDFGRALIGPLEVVERALGVVSAQLR